MKTERDHEPLAYRLHVVAPDVAEVVHHAAGLIVDRVMAGWQVTVALVDGGDDRPVRILGAEVVDVGTGAVDDCHVLAIAADLYTGATAGEVLVWGGPRDSGCAVQHRLSAAARRFKTEALVAAGIPFSAVEDSEDFAAANSRWGTRHTAIRGTAATARAGR